MSRDGEIHSSLGQAFGRSLFPITAVVIIVGSVWWGPWATFFLAYGWWRTVAVVG